MISENSVTAKDGSFPWMAFGLGAVAGLRTFSAPASLWKTPGLNLLAAGEMIGDKLPFTPARTSPVALAARAVSGGVAGARTGRTIGAVLAGVAGAIGAAYGMYHLRKYAAKRLQLPDPLLGLAEDALVGVLALTLSRAASKYESR